MVFPFPTCHTSLMFKSQHNFTTKKIQQLLSLSSFSPPPKPFFNATGWPKMANLQALDLTYRPAPPRSVAPSLPESRRMSTTSSVTGGKKTGAVKRCPIVVSGYNIFWDISFGGKSHLHAFSIEVLQGPMCKIGWPKKKYQKMVQSRSDNVGYDHETSLNNSRYYSS